MTTQQNRKRPVLFGVAILLLMCASALLFLGKNNFELRTLGLASLLFSTFFVRQSNIHASVSVGGSKKSELSLKPFHWIIGTILIILTGAALYALHLDAAEGYKDIAPVYEFAIASILTAIWWAGVFARLISRQEST